MQSARRGRGRHAWSGGGGAVAAKGSRDDGGLDDCEDGLEDVGGWQVRRHDYVRVLVGGLAGLSLWSLLDAHHLSALEAESDFEQGLRGEEAERAERA